MTEVTNDRSDEMKDEQALRQSLLEGLKAGLAGAPQPRLFRVYEGSIHKMFAEEPDL